MERAIGAQSEKPKGKYYPRMYSCLLQRTVSRKTITGLGGGVVKKDEVQLML